MLEKERRIEPLPRLSLMVERFVKDPKVELKIAIPIHVQASKTLTNIQVKYENEISESSYSNIL